MTNFEKVGVFMKTFNQDVKVSSSLGTDKINSLRISLINSSFIGIDTEFFNLGTPNHEFPENTFINPNQAVVVFGGPQDSTFNSASFGNSLVFSSSNVVMNLNNGGDIMTFTDNSGNILIEFDISDYQADNNVNQSYTRNPDLTGLFEQHNGVSGTLFSPGTRADGTPF